MEKVKKSLSESVRSINKFYPHNQDVDFDILEMSLAFNVLSMTRTDGWIQNFSDQK